MDVPPPGVGFTTVIAGVPEDEISVESIAADTCVELIKVVVLAEPFILTTDEDIKLEPVTVNVKFDPPEQTDDGDNDVILGLGLLIVNPDDALAAP